MKPTLIYKKKKFSDRCYVLIHKFESFTHEDRYQFMIRDRYRGHVLWKSTLMYSYMDCCIEGIRMVHDIEDNGHPRLYPLGVLAEQYVKKKEERRIQHHLFKGRKRE